MAIAQELKVLNTLTANGGDCIVAGDGNAYITGLTPFKANSRYNMQKIPAVTEQIQVQKVTFTAANLQTYIIYIQCYDTINSTAQQRIPVTLKASYTSDATGTADEISAGIVAAINNTVNGGYSVSATDVGSASGSVLISGSAGYADFVVQADSSSSSLTSIVAVLTVAFTAAPAGGRTAQGVPVVADAGTITSILITDPGFGYVVAPTVTFSGGSGSAGAGTAVLSSTGEIYGLVASVTVTNAGSGYTGRSAIQPVGTVAALQAKYPYNTNDSNSFADIANLTSGAVYTEWDIDYYVNPDSGVSSLVSDVLKKRGVLLVKESATAIDLQDLQGVYGTLTGLKAGYRVTVSGVSGTDTAAAEATHGAITLVGGTYDFATYNLKSGDYIIVASTATHSFATSVITKITGITTDLLGYGSLVTASAEYFKVAAWRNLGS